MIVQIPYQIGIFNPWIKNLNVDNSLLTSFLGIGGNTICFHNVNIAMVLIIGYF